MPRVAQPLELSMPEGGGSLLIRDAEEPFAIEAPTTLSGDLEPLTGVISGLAFASPMVSFEQPVAGGQLTAFIDATFTDVAAGSGTGLVDPDGNLTLNMALRVDLHIEVPEAGIVADCVTSPVNLELGSTTPYDPDTEEVTVVDPNFTVPPVPVTPTCDGTTVAPQVNATLAGGGHSLSLDLTGAMVLPPKGTEESVTTLTVDPADASALGQEVTLEATVAPGPSTEAMDTPTGVVNFYDGDSLISQVPLVGGTASVMTNALPLGTRSLRAEYAGDSVYRPSESAAQAYVVSAAPVVTAPLPNSVKIGGPSVVVPVETENPPVGAAVNNLRVGVTISRYTESGFSFDPLGPEHLTLEVKREGISDFEEVTLTVVPGAAVPTVSADLGPLGGRPLAPGETFDDVVRFTVDDATTLPGTVTFDFTAYEVAPVGGAVVRTLGSTSGRTNLVPEGRIPTTMQFFDFEGATVNPTILRPRTTLTIPYLALDSPVFSSDRPPTGSIDIFIDGQPVKAWTAAMGLDAPAAESIPIASLIQVFVVLPAWVGTGNHTITALYSGDGVYLPSSRTEPFTVASPIAGTPYECRQLGAFSETKFVVLATSFARVPALVPAGGEAVIEDLDIELTMSRSSRAHGAFGLSLGADTDIESLVFEYGPGGEGAAETAAQVGSPQYDPSDLAVDMSVTFDGETGSVPATQAPGTQVPITFDRFTGRGSFVGSPVAEIVCVPVGNPLTVGTFTVAGTSLSVDAPDPARADDDVVLTATVAPMGATGTVEFYDGDDLIDIAPVVAGQRAITTVHLDEGDHTLIARHRGGAARPSTTSPEVQLQVRPAVECEAFAEDGSGAVVRLVYMELLGRCPDQAGYAYWKGRLAGGTTPESFARAIARTPEAVGRVVDDAYETMLGRPADPGGRVFWIGRLQSHGRYDHLLADLSSSGEFWSQAGGTDEGFVIRVYERLLGRAPDAGGLAYWVDRLEGTSRRALILTLANLDEPLGRLVTLSYDEILGRAPASGERSGGVARLRATGDRSGLYAELIGRPEFATRAQGFPNPED